MNAADLFILSRKLMQLAENALPKQGATSVRLVAVDVAFHPGTSISEIVMRTGFPQSHVSASVARLRDLGALETEIDAKDRRRTLVRMTPMAETRASMVSSASIEDVLAPALTTDDPAKVREVVEALELIDRLLTLQPRTPLQTEVSV